MRLRHPVVRYGICIAALCTASALVGVRIAEIWRPARDVVVDSRPWTTVWPDEIVGVDLEGRLGRWRAADTGRRTLVLFLAADCEICTQNLVNWHDLITRTQAADQPIEVVILSSSALEETAAYIAAHQLPTARVLAIDGAVAKTLELVGTPSTIVLEAAGEARIWGGYLDPPRFGAVEAALLSSEENQGGTVDDNLAGRVR